MRSTRDPLAEIGGSPAIVNGRALSDSFGIAHVAGGPPGGPYSFNYQRNALISFDRRVLSPAEVEEVVACAAERGAIIVTQLDDDEVETPPF